MRILGSFMLALLLALATALPASARVVLLQTSATLEDHSEWAIERALRDALEVAMSGALAMGLSSMRVDRARVLDDAVVIWVVATDEEVDEPDDAAGLQLEQGALQ